MNQRSKAPARLFAAAALIVGVLILILVVSSALDSSSPRSGGKSSSARRSRSHPKPKTTASSYVVKNGDTLTSIAHKTGIPVAEIVSLNPGVDPQILISGEKLKLR